MTVDEALDIVKSQMLLGKTPDRYREYKDYFLLFMFPEGSFDGVIAIDKNEEKLVPYHPLIIPIDEAPNPISQGKIDSDRDVIEHGRIKIEEYLKG